MTGQEDTLVAALVRQAVERGTRRYVKRIIRILWLAAGCTAISIILTDWRWFAVAMLGVFIAGIYVVVIAWAQRPDLQRKLATEIRNQLTDNPNWRPRGSR